MDIKHRPDDLLAYGDEINRVEDHRFCQAILGAQELLEDNDPSKTHILTHLFPGAVR